VTLKDLDMKTIVFSCKYSNILPYFAIQFNKHFDSNQEVIVLSPWDELPPLPANFSHFKLPEFSPSWCNDLMPFFDQFHDEYFHSCMEDHFLHDPVNMDIFAEAEKLVREGTIDKFGFQVGHRPGEGARRFPDNPMFIKVAKEDNVVSSLQPSIWRLSMFRELLERTRDRNAWQFETMNKQPTLPDEFTVFYCPEPEPYPVQDVVRRNVNNTHYWSRFVKGEENIKVFQQATQELFK